MISDLCSAVNARAGHDAADTGNQPTCNAFLALERVYTLSSTRRQAGGSVCAYAESV